MSVHATIDAFTSAEWSEIGRHFSDYNIYQTWGFGEISTGDTNSIASRIVVRDGQSVIGAAQVRIKKLPLLKAGLAYLYFGPMVNCGEKNSESLGRVLDCIRDEYLIRRRLRLRIMPPLWDAPQDDHCLEAFSRCGLRLSNASAPYQTFLVDLEPEISDLRKNLEQKWRNGLNQSEKRGLTLESRTDDAAMQEFEQLYDSMWQRKQFETGVTVSSFRRLQQWLPDGEKLTILLARREDVLIAGHVSSTLGDTCVYLLGASNDLGRECKASYSLQWQAMVAARSAGAMWYDLGGIDPLSNPGVFHFKAGLGGKDVTFAGTFEAQPRGIGRFLLPVAERAYRALRSRRKAAKQQSVATHSDPSRQEPHAQGPCPTIVKLSS